MSKNVELTLKDLNELRECLELLNAIELIEYHNKNWLPLWAIQSPKSLSEEKRNLLKRAISVIGSSDNNRYL